MKIGILGAGTVGANLGKALAAKGHDILLGVRDPQAEKIQTMLQSMTGRINAGTIAEAAAFSDVIVMAVPWTGVEEVVQHVREWKGKILIDATNRFTSTSSASAGEDLARLAQGAKVVKAFNTIGAEHYLNPVFGDQSASMFICGDNEAAKQVAAGLAAELGFDVVDVGALSNARLLESLARLWVTLSRGDMGRSIGFKLLRR